MAKLVALLWSSVGKKLLMAITGLCLFTFLTVHLIGNLTLLRGDPVVFNKYSHFLMSLGLLLYTIEIGMVCFFLIHIVSGISVWWISRKARTVKYKILKSAGGASKKNLASTTMIYTGPLIGIFITLHILTFKYGPYYTTTIDGVEMRDIYRVVIEGFSNPVTVSLYVLVMVIIGFHLSHGFWSAFQSLGFYHKYFTPLLYGLGYVIAVVYAAGYIVIPLWIYFKGGA